MSRSCVRPPSSQWEAKSNVARLQIDLNPGDSLMNSARVYLLGGGPDLDSIVDVQQSRRLLDATVHVI
jgi:hypothetical protein